MADFNISDILAAITAAGVPLIGKAVSGNNTPAPGALAAAGGMPPEVTQMLQQSMARQQYQNPLFQAVTNQAFSGLPAYARQGLSLPSSMPTGVPTASAASGGGMSPLAAGALGAGAGALGGLASGGDLGKLIDLIKKAFARNGSSTQLDKPNAGPDGPTGLPTGNPYNPNDVFFGWPDPSMDQSPRFNIPSDPGVYRGQNGEGASPTDPSGGSGVGPGMQGFNDSGGGFDDGVGNWWPLG